MSWKKEELGKICKTSSGGTPSRKYPEYYENGEITWVKSGELENNTIISAEECISRDGLENSNAKIFPPGTLLIALYGATIGKLAFLGIEAATNQAVCGIFENEKVTLKYLYYFLLFNRPNLIKKGMGGAQSNISQTILKQLLVPYPVSMNAQMDIVSRIEELFSKLDKGVETLQTIKQQLAVYRQAVLKEAFHACEQWPKYAFSDLMCEVRNGYSLKPDDRGEHRILKISAVRPLKLDISETRLNEAPFSEKDIVAENDILFTRYNGSREYVGICAVVPKLEDVYAYPDKLIKCRPKIQSSDHSKYLAYYMSQGNARKYLRSKIKTTSGQNGIAGTDIKKTIVYLPDSQKQSEIVLNIESKLSICDSIEQSINKVLSQADAMRQSILKRAFEGKL